MKIRNIFLETKKSTGKDVQLCDRLAVFSPHGTGRNPKAALVSQAHLIASWLARGTLSITAWTAMAQGHIVTKKVSGKPLQF